MTSHTPTKTPTSVQRENPVPNVEDEIRRRAYELYEQRGREDGHDVDDWLRAEEEVMQTRIRRRQRLSAVA
jgi:Protein of unknown function (DUF2934)